MREDTARTLFYEHAARYIIDANPGLLRARCVCISFPDPRPNGVDRNNTAIAILRQLNTEGTGVRLTTPSDYQAEDNDVSSGILICCSSSEEVRACSALHAERDAVHRVLILSESSSHTAACGVTEIREHVERDAFEAGARAVFQRENKPAVELALVRARARGFAGLTGFGLFDVAEPTADDTEVFCERLSSSWRLSPGHVFLWYQQLALAGFRDHARMLLLHLYREGYVTERALGSHIIELYDELSSKFAGDITVVDIQPPGKSGPRILYSLKRVAQPVTLEQGLQSGARHVVVVDDVVCTGSTMVSLLFSENAAKPVSELQSRLVAGTVHLHVLASHADQTGIDAIRSAAAPFGAVTVHAHKVIADADRVFTSTTFFADLDQVSVKSFKSFCEERGKLAYNKKHGLGYGDLQWCIALDYSVPNATLSILHGSKGGWTPLFARAR